GGEGGGGRAAAVGRRGKTTRRQWPSASGLPFRLPAPAACAPPCADDPLVPMLTVVLAVVLMQSPAVTAPPPAVAEGECVIVAPLDATGETAAGGAECDRRTLPASTFKIPHALIALDTGVVTEQTRMKWDGTRQDFRSWERDHTLDSAIKWS